MLKWTWPLKGLTIRIACELRFELLSLGCTNGQLPVVSLVRRVLTLVIGMKIIVFG